MGLMEAEAEELNAGFLKRMRHGSPFVRVKGGHEPRRAHGPRQRPEQVDYQRGRPGRRAALARANSAAILTGIGTVLADDPQLNVRLPDVERQPTVVVLDANARTLPTARLFTGGGPVVVFTQRKARCPALRARSA